MDRTASDDEIKRAYKKRALVHHPDRHANASEEEKYDQEKKFKEVGEAYNILSDARKRARYDQGVDIDGSGGGFSPGYADIDPTNIFNAFFAGNGNPGFAGPQFTFAGSRGGGRSGYQPGGFPGGY